MKQQHSHDAAACRLCAPVAPPAHDPRSCQGCGALRHPSQRAAREAIAAMPGQRTGDRR